MNKLISCVLVFVLATFGSNMLFAQTLKLGLLLDIKNLPEQQLTSTVGSQGVWQTESASADSQHIVFSPVAASDTYESIEIKRSPLLTISYYTQDMAWYDSLKREAVRMRFRLLNKETISGSETIHTLQKDSVYIVEFHQTASTGEIHLFPYQDFYRSFFVSQEETWSMKDRFAFMEKCMTKMPKKLPFKYALKACGCGGNYIQSLMKYKFVEHRSVDELILMMKQCTMYYEDKIRNQN